MTAPRRGSGRRVLSWALALALLGVLGFVVIRDVRADGTPPVTTVTGVIGSERLPFAGTPAAPQTFTVAAEDPGPDRQRIADAGAALQPGGDTAIYDSLAAAYRIAGEQMAADPDRFTSIVLMTDGENTSGADLEDFRASAAARPEALRDVPVFCVLFGESSVAEMTEVARLTGGRTFDARTTPLAEVFQEIRGYV